MKRRNFLAGLALLPAVIKTLGKETPTVLEEAAPLPTNFRDADWLHMREIARKNPNLNFGSEQLVPGQFVVVKDNNMVREHTDLEPGTGYVYDGKQLRNAKNFHEILEEEYMKQWHHEVFEAAYKGYGEGSKSLEGTWGV